MKASWDLSLQILLRPGLISLIIFSTNVNASQVFQNVTTDQSNDFSPISVRWHSEDDKPFDIEEVTTERQTLECEAPDPDSMDSHALGGLAITHSEAQLQEKSAADLIAMVHQMQTSPARQLSDIREQYTAVSTLGSLRS